MADTLESPAFPPVTKESKAQRAERLKSQKNPWDSWDEGLAFARSAYNSILPEWASTSFRWWGIYTQGSGVGVTVGTCGALEQTEKLWMGFAHPDVMGPVLDVDS